MYLDFSAPTFLDKHSATLALRGRTACGETAIVSRVSDDERSGSSKGSTGVLAATVGGVFVVLAAMLGNTGNLAGVLPGSPTQTVQVTLPQETVTETITQTLTATATETVTMDQPPGPTPNDARPAMFLDEIEPVGDDLNRESVTWRDQTFSRSLTNPLSGCSAIGPVDWVIPVGYAFFDAEIGVAEDAAEPDARVTFNVYVGGDPVVTETFTVGQHQPLRVPLGEASRIRLETIIDQSRRGNCNTEATSVFGDARFTN